MTNLQAAVGVAQLERLDDFVARKPAAGEAVHRATGGVAGIELPLAGTDYAENIYWVFGIVLRDEVPWMPRNWRYA